METIADADADREARGIRFYEAAPFVLVTSDGKGGLNSELIYLPDTTRKRSARPYAFMASNNSTLTFSNGVLTGAKIIADETVVPKAIVTAIQTAASAAVKAATLGAADVAAPAGPFLPPPTLLRVVVKGDVFMLKGSTAVSPDGTTEQPINVTITEAATAAGAPK